MNPLYFFLLVLWAAFNLSDAEDPDEHTTQDPWQLRDGIDTDTDTDHFYNLWEMMNESHQRFSADIYPEAWINGDSDFEEIDAAVFDEYETESDNVPEPNITVYRQIENREQVIVLCKPAEMFRRTYRRQSIELTVESELKYTIEPLHFIPFFSSEMRVFLVTVRPPASFTCVQEIDFSIGVRNLRSQTYNYTGSVSDHHEEGASLLYICFSSFIAVGLFIMTAAVIVINIRSKTKDTNFTAVTDNDYVEA